MVPTTLASVALVMAIGLFSVTVFVDRSAWDELFIGTFELVGRYAYGMGLIPYFCSFSSKVVVCGHCFVPLLLPGNKTIKWLSLLPILKELSFGG